MRKFIVTFLPASLLLACLAMVLSTCGGGGGGGGGGAPPATLSGLSINGPSSVSEYGTGTYTATASWSDNSTTTVTPTWSVNPQVAEISTGGVFSCRGGVASDQTVTVSATYSSGGITKTGTMDVTITNIITIPFTAPMLSGKVFYREDSSGGGASDSSLLYFNTDLTFREDYDIFGAPDRNLEHRFVREVGHTRDKSWVCHGDAPFGFPHGDAGSRSSMEQELHRPRHWRKPYRSTIPFSPGPM